MNNLHHMGFSCNCIVGIFFGVMIQKLERSQQISYKRAVLTCVHNDKYVNYFLLTNVQITN